MISLKVGGKSYEGWKSARVTRSMESVAGSFELEVAWADRPQSAWPIREGDECTVEIDGETVITGYVDRRSVAYGPESHSLTVVGRDKTGDLVDCSVDLGKWEFANAHVQALASTICERFGIEVTLHSRLGQAEIPRVLKLSIDPGDSAFEAIERACRLAGVLAYADGLGGLVIARAGTGRARVELVEGVNILSASADFDISGRFHVYQVLAQHPGSATYHSAGAAAVRGEAIDETVERLERVLLIRAEGAATKAQAKKRAEWEATVRSARGDSVSVTVHGWRQKEGAPLWPVNALTKVRSPLLGVDGDMLISTVEFSIDDTGGEVTHLTLRPPKAFTPEPRITKATARQWQAVAGGV